MKQSISDKYEDVDGTIKERGASEDLLTLQKRIFTRVVRAMGEDKANELVIPGVNSYNAGDYFQADSWFDRAIHACPAVEPELAPHREICQRVWLAAGDAEDHVHEWKIRRWRSMSIAGRLFNRLFAGDTKPDFLLRCKYCGHFTPYIGPNVGWAHLRGNNCLRCGRGYPMPDLVWDGVDGQAYIYYRGSVSDYAFYKEFEARFEVNPRMRPEGGKWTKVPPATTPPSVMDEILRPEFTRDPEGWGRALGKEWVARMSRDELLALTEARVKPGASLAKSLPADLAAERDWCLRWLEQCDECSGSALLSVKGDFNLGLDEVVSEAISDAVGEIMRRMEDMAKEREERVKRRHERGSRQAKRKRGANSRPRPRSGTRQPPSDAR